MANGLNVGPRLVDSRVYPEFSIRPTVAGKLMTFDVENKQVVFSNERRTRARWENKCVCPWNARAHMSECRRDTLPVENVTCGDNVLFEVIEIHGVFRFTAV